MNQQNHQYFQGNIDYRAEEKQKQEEDKKKEGQAQIGREFQEGEGQEDQKKEGQAQIGREFQEGEGEEDQKKEDQAQKGGEFQEGEGEKDKRKEGQAKQDREKKIEQEFAQIKKDKKEEENVEINITSFNLKKRPINGKCIAQFPENQINLQPKQNFQKSFIFQNNGAMPWSKYTSFQYAQGDFLGFHGKKIGAMNPDQSRQIKLNLIAPQNEGKYISYMSLFDQENQKNFGHTVWCSIRVIKENTSNTKKPNSVDQPSEKASIQPRKLEQDVRFQSYPLQLQTQIKEVLSMGMINDFRKLIDLLQMYELNLEAAVDYFFDQLHGN